MPFQTRTPTTRLLQSRSALASWSDPVKKAARLASMLAKRKPTSGNHKPHSEATKAKIREAQLARWEGIPRTRQKKGKPEKPRHPMLILKGGVWVSNKKEEMSSQD